MTTIITTAAAATTTTTFQWLPIALKIKLKLLNIYFKTQFYFHNLVAVQTWVT